MVYLAFFYFIGFATSRSDSPSNSFRIPNFSFVNNCIKYSSTEGQSAFINYAYNENNFPITLKATGDGITGAVKFVYSNCQ